MIRFSIRRPVAVTMAYMCVAALGVLAWRNLPIELLPNASYPRLTVEATWRGASPETVEAFLTSPIEAAIQQVRRVERIVSTSSEQVGTGRARIDIEFERGTDMNFARLELSERLAAIEEDLPAESSTPYVTPYIPEAFSRQQRNFLDYTITGPYTTEALRGFVDEYITEQLLQLDGIAAVRAWGGRDRVLELELHEARIRSLNVSIDRVRQLIGELEYVREAGAVYQQGMLRPVALRHRPDSIAQILNVIVSSDSGRIVRLRDIATIHDTYEEPSEYYRIDGRPAVSFQIIKEIGTNTVEVADRTKARIAELEKALPPGVRLFLDTDESESIKAQLTDLKYRSLGSAAIVFFVLLIFLRSFRSTVITFSTIGFSILITLNLLYFGGFTLNVLTLMGLAMGFGMMVDNAIVVLENIYRKRRLGSEAVDAAERGSLEVALPILAATITNVIVLLPFVYLQGELKVYYVPLAIVVGFAQIASLFVGFTFIPALAARLLNAPKFARRRTGAAQDLPLYARGYMAVIRRSLRWPWATVIISLLLLGGSYYMFRKHVTTGVLWRPWYQDETSVTVNIRQQRGEELESTDQLARFFESKLVDFPEIERYTTNVSAITARIHITFPDSLENTSYPVMVKEILSENAVQLGGASISVAGVGPAFSTGGFGGGASPNYSIKVLGYNYERVREIADDLGSRLSRFSRVREVDTNGSGNSWSAPGSSDIVVHIDRQKLALHGITVQELIRQLNAAVRGRNRDGAIMVAGEEMQYAVKLAGHRYLDVLQLMDLLLPTPSGKLVRLADVATQNEREIMGSIVRENQQYQRTVRYEFRGPPKLGDFVKNAVLEATQLPPGFSIAEDDRWYWSEEEKSQIYLVLAFGIVLIFMVSATLFESLRQPLCVLLTVPMALIGVFVMFWLAGASFTREAYIGTIMMAGIVVNNAILLLDHVNLLRRQDGLPMEEALVRGSTERVRPILMTSVTTIAGLLPLVLFSEAADANIWNALGYALIGGLSSSTFLVLTVTPALYLLFERRAERRRLARAGQTPAAAMDVVPAPAQA